MLNLVFNAVVSKISDFEFFEFFFGVRWANDMIYCGIL